MTTAALTNSTTPESERDLWATPWEVVRAVEAWLGMRFSMDVCAVESNAKVERWLGPDRHGDSLALDWTSRQRRIVCAPAPAAPVLWMNPPYSNPSPWCAKAAEESRRGLIVVGLLPDDRSTRWYQQHIEGVASVCLVPTKRISFLGTNGKPVNGNPKGSVLPIWTPWRTGRTEYVRIDLGAEK